MMAGKFSSSSPVTANAVKEGISACPFFHTYPRSSMVEMIDA